MRMTVRMPTELRSFQELLCIGDGKPSDALSGASGRVKSPRGEGMVPQCSENLGTALRSAVPPPPDHARRAHNRRQARLFNQAAPQFDELIPLEVKERLEQIVAAAGVKPGETVLDVATGTGVLLPLILAQNPSQVLACDLSRNMLQRARAKFKGKVRFFQKDVVDLAGSIGPVDVVLCNACFGNFYDSLEALRAINILCRNGGRVVISHPLGREFVRRLRDEHPEMVASELPGQARLEAMLEATDFRLESLQDHSELYLAVARKVARAEHPDLDTHTEHRAS